MRQHLRQVVEQPVSTVDLAATFCDAGDTSLIADAQSRSLLPLMRGEAQERKVAYSEWHVHASRCGVALKLRTVRTRDAKCTFELDSGAGELYDLRNDPGEMVNRFDDPSFKGLRDELEQMMRDRPGEVRDPLAEPIGMA